MKSKCRLFLALCFLAAGSPGLAAAAQTPGTDYLLQQTLLKPPSEKNKRLAQSSTATPTSTSEKDANTEEIPGQILKTGVILNAPVLCPNSLQLSNNIGLTPLLERINSLSTVISQGQNGEQLEGLSRQQDLLEAKQATRLLIQKTSLEIDATSAQIAAERELYNEILSKFKTDRDKAIARTNALSFISNGALWAVTYALVIPTYKHAIYNVPAGILGIPAGLVPSAASMYTLKLVSGKKKTSEVDPNMLARLFDYPTSSELEYPRSIWTYLNEVPADSPNAKTRKQQLIDRWIADANMPAFNDRNSRKQLDVLTASVSHKKALTIDTLTARTIMLEQLLAEIYKMKRLLLELEMAAMGDKQIASN